MDRTRSCASTTPRNTALVVDSGTGDVLYRGPTDVETASVTLNLERLGPYAVATTPDRGIYGIGSRAETTWFVPGDGSTEAVTTMQLGAGAAVLSSQRGTDPKLSNYSIFSAADGTPVTPDVEPGATLHDPAVYPGGFAANVKPRTVSISAPTSSINLEEGSPRWTEGSSGAH